MLHKKQMLDVSVVHHPLLLCPTPFLMDTSIKPWGPSYSPWDSQRASCFLPVSLKKSPSHSRSKKTGLAPPPSQKGEADFVPGERRRKGRNRGADGPPCVVALEPRDSSEV